MTTPVIPLRLDLTSEFTIRNASALALASQWAYTLTPTIEGVLTDSQAILFDAGSAYVLANRGTSELRDWLTDCKFLLRSVPDLTPLGKIHDGFADALNDLRKDMLAQVQSAMAVQVKPLFICGHSLGGSLAILDGDFLTRQGIAVQAVYTYGQPRVGNRQYAASYNSLLGSRTFRVVYQDDLVPHVPLPGFFFQYLQNQSEAFLFQRFAGIPHVAFNRPTIQKLFSDGVMCYHAWQLLRLCAGNPVAVPLALIEAVKANHAIENYISKLNSLN